MKELIKKFINQKVYGNHLYHHDETLYTKKFENKKNKLIIIKKLESFHYKKWKSKRVDTVLFIVKTDQFTAHFKDIKEGELYAFLINKHDINIADYDEVENEL